MSKIVISNIEEACECPFYVKNAKNTRKCFIKQTTSLSGALMVTENNPEYDEDLWDEDCGGQYDNCSIIPLLYRLTPQVKIAEEDEIDKYNPFEAISEEMDSRPEIDVAIYKVNSIYKVKSDVLVYPTNQDLFVEDETMPMHSKIQIQAECDKIQRPVELGNVCITSNGGNTSDPIKAKKIYHAVVATNMRLVNPEAIEQAIIKSLLVAENNSAKHVALLPCDCGAYDIHQTALKQLSAIKKFIATNKVNHIEKISILMNDEESIDAFQEFFDRIFQNG